MIQRDRDGNDADVPLWGPASLHWVLGCGRHRINSHLHIDVAQLVVQ